MWASHNLHFISHFQSFGSYELMSFFWENARGYRSTNLKHNANFSFPHSYGHGKWLCSEVINLSLRLRACLQSQSQEKKNEFIF